MKAAAKNLHTHLFHLGLSSDFYTRVFPENGLQSPGRPGVEVKSLS
jgi:hypothetical protein